MDFDALARECAPQVAVATMRAVARHESGLDPLAIGINRRADRKARLSRRPETAAEAIGAARDLIARGYRIDMGIAQVSNQWLGRAGLKADGSPVTLADVFDACTGLSIGAAILAQCRQRSANLHEALSCYNTGNRWRGLSNGYVGAVYRAARLTGRGA